MKSSFRRSDRGLSKKACNLSHGCGLIVKENAGSIKSDNESNVNASLTIFFRKNTINQLINHLINLKTDILFYNCK